MSDKNLTQQLVLIVDNVRSVLNVGSFFRTADATRVNEIFLCGYTPTPDKNDMSKTALGAEATVKWRYFAHTWRAIEHARSEGLQIVALEQSPKSINYLEFSPKFPVALIIGNEVDGISPKILERCDTAIELPMHGTKESLNVAVALGIALYKLNESRQ